MASFKVIHIIWALNSGGAENMLVDIINEQCKTEHVGLIIINKSYDLSIFKRIDKRVKVWEIGRKEGSRSLFPIIKLNLLILQLNYSCLHCHNHELIKILKLNSKPVYLTVHDTGIDSTYLPSYTKLFAISQAVQVDIQHRIILDSQVIYNGIITSDVKVNKPSDNSSFRVLQVSRLDHSKKGQHILIEALYLLKKKNMLGVVKCDFIGEGRSLAYLVNLVKEYDLGDCVSFFGIKEREFIYKNLCNYNLLVQPSINEGFGLTVAEGMAAKVPVLVSDNEGPLEIIDNGKYGFYFENGSAEDCARQIANIVNMKKIELEIIKEKAFKRVINDFNINSTAKEYFKNYNH